MIAGEMQGRPVTLAIDRAVAPPPAPVPWIVPPAWRGERCFILAGGASLLGVDLDRLRRSTERHGGKVIAIKGAGLDLYPEADVLWWADRAFLDGDPARRIRPRRADLHRHTGTWKATRTPPDVEGHDVKWLEHDHRADLADRPGFVGGFCSTANCIDLAGQLGAAPTVLVGVDMGGPAWDGRARLAGRSTQWHPQGTYVELMMPSLRRQARLLAQRGVAVLNASPTSALDCFPKVDLETLL